MSSEKELVITAYGHDNVIDKISVSYFSSSSSHWQYRNDSDANTYCKMINNLELVGASWIFAKIIPENTPIDLSLFLPLRFSDLILRLTDRTLQKVFRELDSQELATALKGCGEAVLEKVYKNMTSRASQMLKEDMESMKPVRKKDVMAYQDKIIQLLQHLADVGEIVITGSEENK
jgi:hypothetical protein